jgi:serine/threonine-protein kinase
VYSLGVVLYELLVGGVPYEGETFVTVALKHVNEPTPSVLDRRPELPPRVALAVERAMAKSPDERFASMQELVDELEACLDELDPSAEQATMISRRPVAPKRARQPRRKRRLGVLWPIAAVLAVLAVAGLAALGALALRDGDDDPQAAPTRPIPLSGIGAYDPRGDDAEHDDEAGLATDGDQSTFWRTERYDSGLTSIKEGVGLVLDAQSTVSPRTMTVTTDTPGFTLEIRAGESPEGPFETVSSSREIDRRVRFNLRDAESRYFLVWITELEGTGHVNEVAAR